MPKTEVNVTEQMTDFVDFALLSDADGDGVPEAAINLSAADHVELVRRDKGGTVTTFSSAGASPQLTFPSGWAAAGSVRWAPGTVDIQASKAPYGCQFKVFVTGTRWYYVPEDARFTVHAQERIA